MAVGGPCHAGAVGGQVEQFDDEWIVAVVKLVFDLGGGIYAFAARTFEPFLEFFDLIGVEQQRIVGIAFKFVAEVFGDQRLDVVEGGGFVLFEFAVGAAEGDIGAFLDGHPVNVGLIMRAGKTECEAAGFVVGGDDDQGVVRIAEREVVSDFDRVVHADGFTDISADVVGVSAPVDFSAFDHDEEAVVVVEQINGFCGDVSQCQIVLRHVKIVRHGVAVKFGGDGDGRNFVESVKLLPGGGYGVSVGAGEVKKIAVGVFGVLPVHIAEGAAAEEIEF